MKTIFAILILLHGAIHLLGFIRSLDRWMPGQLKAGIIKVPGLPWLLTFILFTISGIAFLTDASWAGWITIPAVIISVILIISAWVRYRSGMLSNILILFVACFLQISDSFEKKQTEK